MGSSFRRIGVVAALAAAAMAFTQIPAQAGPTWADADTATIHPGVQTFTDGAQCTANFVFTDDAGAVYIGQAAHCAGLGQATETNGCDAASLPLGTPVEVDGATRPGTLVYSSWLSMQVAGETDAETCAYNDFALIALDPADRGRVNPSIPGFGGPNGIAGPTQVGDIVYSYGNSSLRLGLSPLSPKMGTSIGTTEGGWSHGVLTVTPGIPGDSGSAFVNDRGEALGVLSTLALLPVPGSNNVSDLGHALDYLAAHTDLSVALANGTESHKATDPIRGVLTVLGIG